MTALCRENLETLQIRSCGYIYREQSKSPIIIRQGVEIGEVSKNLVSTCNSISIVTTTCENNDMMNNFLIIQTIKNPKMKAQISL